MSSEKADSASNGESKRSSLIKMFSDLRKVFSDELLFSVASTLVGFCITSRQLDASGWDSVIYTIVLTYNAVAIVHQTILIARSRSHAPRIVVIATAWTFFSVALLFAVIYWRIGTPPNFNAELSKVDAIYFALGTLTTAGTGTIAPTSGLARGLVSGQMVLGFVFIAVAVTVAITRWSERSS